MDLANMSSMERDFSIAQFRGSYWEKKTDSYFFVMRLHAEPGSCSLSFEVISQCLEE